MSKKERGLGRGLEALLSSEGSDYANVADQTQMDINLIISRQDQPRKNFDQSSLQEMADSIAQHGILQPIIIRPAGKQYEIIAGERRWRAARQLGLNMVPVIIKEMDDLKAAEVSLIENLQRDDLNVVEEARAYKYIIETFRYTQEIIAGKIGKSRAHVANTLRILSLPDIILQNIELGKISAGHARALLSLSLEEQLKAVEAITAEKLSVREAEKIARSRSDKTQKKSIELAEIEEKLQKYFGTKVQINAKKKGGRIEIAYYNESDLERIIEALGLL